MESPMRFKHLIWLAWIVITIILMYMMGRSIYELGYSKANLDRAKAQYDECVYGIVCSGNICTKGDKQCI